MALYVDIGIGAIVIIALIIGIVKGISKQFTKGFCGLVAVLGSIVLTILLMPYIQNVDAFKSFVGITEKWFTKEYFTATIASTEDLNAVLSQGLLKILSRVSDRIYNAMQIGEMTTLGAYFGDLLARIITGLVLWTLLLSVINLIFLGIRRLFVKMAALPILRTPDKILGGIWAVGIAYLIVICLIVPSLEIAVIKWMPDRQAKITQIIEESHLFKFLHNTNAIGSFIAQLFEADLQAILPA